MSALSSSQLSHHPVLHPLAVSHDQFEDSQRVRAHCPTLQVCLMLGECALALRGLVVPLQRQERIAKVVLAVALLDESISVLSLIDTQKHTTHIYHFVFKH